MAPFIKNFNPISVLKPEMAYFHSRFLGVQKRLKILGKIILEGVYTLEPQEDTMSRYCQENSENDDQGYDSAYDTYRDHGRYGSSCLYDRYNDESSAEED